MTHKAIKNDFSFEILIKTFQDPLFKLFSNITITGLTGTTNLKYSNDSLKFQYQNNQV